MTTSMTTSMTTASGTMDRLSLTPIAAQHIAKQGGILRIQVKGGGCSGLRYIFTMEDQVQNSDYDAVNNPTHNFSHNVSHDPASKKKDDLIFTDHGSSVVTDPLSFHFIAGSTVDYKEEMLSSHFVIINPKASNACGCGDSFSVG